ncbi:resolvase family protein [Corynebacterium testudinoris]|uniref:Resolvase family protein n=1 Tax=Corynebacterium testudinoris TaxID=136857 RepID=A0A0G3HE73_9CORY|nr:resolvase family protein [Corynebacterium testudinoris]
MKCPYRVYGELSGEGSLCDTLIYMSKIMVGYARVSTEEQDLTAQRDALASLGVEPERVYVDHGFTGRNKNRAGLHEALAACRAGDTFVVTKLDRLARSVRDAHEIADDLARREIRLSIGGSVHDPTGCCCKVRGCLRTPTRSEHQRMKTGSSRLSA